MTALLPKDLTAEENRRLGCGWVKTREPISQCEMTKVNRPIGPKIGGTSAASMGSQHGWNRMDDATTRARETRGMDHQTGRHFSTSCGCSIGLRRTPSSQRELAAKPPNHPSTDMNFNPALRAGSRESM